MTNETKQGNANGREDTQEQDATPAEGNSSARVGEELDAVMDTFVTAVFKANIHSALPGIRGLICLGVAIWLWIQFGWQYGIAVLFVGAVVWFASGTILHRKHVRSARTQAEEVAKRHAMTLDDMIERFLANQKTRQSPERIIFAACITAQSVDESVLTSLRLAKTQGVLAELDYGGELPVRPATAVCPKCGSSAKLVQSTDIHAGPLIGGLSGGVIGYIAGMMTASNNVSEYVCGECKYQWGRKVKCPGFQQPAKYYQDCERIQSR